jgi:esterase
MHRRHVVVSSMRLHYLDWGTPGRPPVLFLHGGGLNAHTWDLVCLDLRRDYHCYALDLRGHGDSEWSPTLDYALDAHARDLEGFIDELGTERLVAIGHSLGGHAAIRYATEHGDRLAGLVVVDTSPFARDGPTLTRVREFMLGANSFETLNDAVEYVLAFNPNRDVRKVRRTLEYALRQLPDGRWTWKRDQRHLSERYFDDAITAVRSLLRVVPAITCPTLVVRGEQGGLSARDAERFCSLLPDGRVAVVERAGHNVQSDNPARLVEVLRAFLAHHHGDEDPITVQS